MKVLARNREQVCLLLHTYGYERTIMYEAVGFQKLDIPWAV